MSRQNGKKEEEEEEAFLIAKISLIVGDALKVL
jgi:hypothetical protein